MSRIYTSLQLLETEKQEKGNGGPILNLFEERAVSAEQEPDSKPPELRPEKILSEFKEKTFQEEQGVRPMPVFIFELANHFKSTLGSIKALTELSQGRFKDTEFGTNFYRMVNEDIDKTDSEIDCFLEYMKIKSPVPKANTVHNLLEALLVVHEKKLKDKKIKIAKRQYDRDLPETSVTDEQLRYILNWILQYAILATAPNGNIGIFTKSLDNQDGRDEGKAWGTREGRHMEILVVFNGWEKAGEQAGAPQELQAAVKQNGKNLILPFVEEIVQENRGMMRFKGDSEKHISQISLVLPVEKRKMNCYQLVES